MSGLPARVYSDEQVEAWLELIGLPKDFRPDHVPGKDLEALAKIQVHHLSAIPFENLEIHYSNSHSISLDFQALFERIVRRKLGGYCMQGNTLLEHMLRALGFTLYSTGSRVRPRTHGIPSGPFLGWVHQVLIVTLAGGGKCVVDVAFGGDVPIQPMPLREDAIVQNIGPARTRLTRRSLGYQTEQQAWIYQIMYTPDNEWVDVHCFYEFEFLPQDYGVMNYWTSTNPASYMPSTIICVKMIKEGDSLVGKLILHGATLRKNLRGTTETILECRTEQERTEVLQKYLGIVLNDEEKAAIKDFPTALVS